MTLIPLPTYETVQSAASGTLRIGGRSRDWYRRRRGVVPKTRDWNQRPPSIRGVFVGREQLARNVADALRGGGPVVLMGGAGSGKTRLAAEVTYQRRFARLPSPGRFPGGIWSPAGATLDETLRLAAAPLGVTSDDPNDLAEEVRKAIRTLPPAAVWVVDNLPDLRDQFEHLRAVAGHLRLVITTRDARAELLTARAEPFRVGGLAEADAVALLTSAADGPKPDHPLLPDIADEVGYLPIALEVLALRLAAGAAPPAAVLDELRSDVPADQKEIFSDAAGPIDRSHGVFNALNSALTDLANADPETRERLAPFGYLADAPVPLGLAHALTGLGDPAFQAFLRACRTRSLLAIDGSTIAIHALTTACIAATNPPGALAGALAPLTKRQAAVAQSRLPSIINADVPHYVRFLRECRQNSDLGPEHPNTLSIAANLAIVYQDAGRAAEAIPLHEATLNIRERMLGPEHPDTLVSRNDLANAYRDAGRAAEAIPLHEATLKIRARLLGPEHPDTLASRNNLANAYQDAGRAAEAIPLHEATLNIRERVLGPEHPDTLVTRNNLAATYAGAGRAAEAIPLFEATLEIRERVLGPEHPDTLVSRNNLAATYANAGRAAEAILLHEETLQIRERVLGPEHPDTLTSRNNLAATYADAGRAAEAIPLHEATLEARKRVLGPEHPDTLGSRNNLANAYRAAGRASDADRIDPE